MNYGEENCKMCDGSRKIKFGYPSIMTIGKIDWFETDCDYCNDEENKNEKPDIVTQAKAGDV